MKRRNFLQAGLIGLLTPAAHAQFGQLKLPKVPGVKLPDFNGEQFIKHTPPLSTNLADVYEAIAGFDDYLPTDAAPLTLVPRNPSGEYLALPGLFEIVAESFCLKAGSNPPSKNTGKYGSGYLYAPLKGPKAGQIERILLHSEDHPELPQYEVQLLLWAIIAEQKLSECPKNIQKTARLLLDEKDRRVLENDVLAVVPPPLRAKVYGSLPPLVREGLEAENKMRELLAAKLDEVSSATNPLVESANAPGQKVSALYVQMEQLAMRVGPLPEISEKEKVPWGQWSWHPEGFFIRILPEGYATTTRQLYYPEAFRLSGESLVAPDGSTLLVSGKTLTLGKTVVTLEREQALRGDAKSLIALRRAAFVAEEKGNQEHSLSNFLARAALSALAAGKPVASGGSGSTSPFTTCRGGGFSGGGGGGAGMGAPGTQRLGQSPKPKDPPSIEKARAATNALQKFGSAAKAPGIPLALAGHLVGWQLDMGAAIGGALNGQNTDHVDTPGGGHEQELPCDSRQVCGSNDDDGLGIVPLPRPTLAAQGGEPKALTNARQAFSDALSRLSEVGRARQAAELRFKQSATVPNGRTLVALRRLWGVSQLAVADMGEALVAAYTKAGGTESPWSAESWAAYRRSLAQGPTASDRADAHAVGLSDTEIAALHAEHVRQASGDPPSSGTVTSLSELCAALRDSGTLYARLPVLSRSLERNLEP